MRAPAIPARARRAYALLLKAYPPAFRADVGEEMAAAFADRYQDEAARAEAPLPSCGHAPCGTPHATPSPNGWRGG